MPGGGCWGRPAPGQGVSLDWSSLQAPGRPRAPGTGPGKPPSPGLVAIASVAPSPPRQLRRGVKDGAKKWAGPCQAAQVVPFYGHAAAGGAWEPGLGGIDVKSRSRARTQLFLSPAPCGVLAPQEDGLPLGAPSLGHASLPSSVASGGSCSASPGYPDSPGRAGAP